MAHVFRIPESSNPKIIAFLEYIRTLDFVKEDKIEKTVQFPTMTDKQIINRVALANKQIKQGKTISQDQLYKDSQNW